MGTGPDFGVLPPWWLSALLVPVAVVAGVAVTWVVAVRASRLSPTEVLQEQ